MINIRNILRLIASTKLFFYECFWLMILLIVGTVAQKYEGLFETQKTYFFSYYFLKWHIPFPGGGLIILLMSIGLMARLILDFNFKKNKLGIHLVHLGSLFLLLGSMFSHLNSIEGSLILKEGEQKNTITDYKEFELTILDDQSTPFLSIDIKNNEVVSNKLGINNSKIISNCELVKKSSELKNEIGFAKLFDFKKSSSESGITCLEFKYNNNVYRIFNDMPKLQSLVIDGKEYTLKLQNKSVTLPFSVKLNDFQKEFHPDTLISKSFKSLVTISDGKLNTNYTIQMNLPLRYKGFTFYQSSFSENSNGESSELAVVKNSGELIPYISTIIITLGLLIHLFYNGFNKLRE